MKIGERLARWWRGDRKRESDERQQVVLSEIEGLRKDVEQIERHANPLAALAHNVSQHAQRRELER